jgi:hypothetical protein
MINDYGVILAEGLPYRVLNRLLNGLMSTISASCYGEMIKDTCIDQIMVCVYFLLNKAFTP